MKRIPFSRSIALGALGSLLLSGPLFFVSGQAASSPTGTLGQGLSASANRGTPIMARTADEAEIRQLTAQWFAAWSPGAERIDWEAMSTLFMQEPGALLVFDDAGDSMVVLESWTEYRATWEPFMEQFSEWQIAPEGEIRVIVDGDLATTVFTLAGGGRDQAGKAIQFRQWGTHVWQRIDNRWVIVHEHLTTGN